MLKANLEDVFKNSGIPTYTFVKPVEYQKLLVSLRTPGRGLVLEGPSGIGKTTSLTKALEELDVENKNRTIKLSARKKEDRDFIAAIPSMQDIGIIIIDDFHRLDPDIKYAVADYLKTLADEEIPTSKLVVVGINKVGDSLISFSKDLNDRIDTIRFEINPEERVIELIEKGENALSIQINTRLEIAKDAQGSFNIAQMLCHATCLEGNVTERCEETKSISVSLQLVRERVLEERSRQFFEVTRKFASGPKLRREGRAPYLHILHWLATSNEWSIQLDQEMARYPSNKSSVSQVVEKKYLEKHLKQNIEFSDILHYDPQTRILSVEDPKFVYYIRNILWARFAQQVGFLGNLEFRYQYDFALSFAGTDRHIAEAITHKLTESEIAVFYDKNEQSRILAENVEDYLAPIYRSEAQFIVVLLGREYPKRIWTKFESEQFKTRFGSGNVIPIWFSDAPPGMFDVTTQVGGMTYDTEKELRPQVSEIVNNLIEKLANVRAQQPIQLNLFNSKAAYSENE